MLLKILPYKIGGFMDAFFVFVLFGLLSLIFDSLGHVFEISSTQKPNISSMIFGKLSLISAVCSGVGLFFTIYKP